jgi:hypothetical protein
MYNFYILLSKNKKDQEFNQFYKKNNFIADLNSKIDGIDLSIYKIDNLYNYFSLIKKRDKNSKAVVSDWSNTFMLEKELTINEPVMKFMYNCVENDYSFFVCTIIKDKFLLEYVQNDIELYYKNKDQYPLFPQYSNYIACVGDRVCKRFFIASLQNFYNVELLLDDNIYNLVKYYDPQLSINHSEIPKFNLYINNENRASIEPKIKFYILVKLLEFEIKKNKIDIYDIGTKNNYNIENILTDLYNKNIYFNKNSVISKIETYYDFMLKNSFLIRSNENLLRETNISNTVRQRKLYRSKYFKYKNDYLEAKYKVNPSKHQLITKNINSHTVNFNRASTLIVEKNFYSQIANGPTVILFKDTKWKTFIEPGGRIDRDVKIEDFNQVLIDTAVRELREETLNTFNFHKNLFKNALYIDSYDKIRKTYGRTFILCLNENSFDETVYEHNKKLLFNQEATNDNIVWRETNDVNRFFISDLEKCLQYYKGFDVICSDVNGLKNKIYYNTANIIYSALKQNIYEKVLQKPIDIKKDNLANNELFLKGTITYIPT